MSAAQAGGTGADHGYLLACWQTRLEKAYIPARGGVTGVPLQPADLNRRLHQHVIHTGAFAEYLRRACPGTTAAQDIRFQNRPGGPEVVLVENLANEFRDVDMRRAGARAR